MAIKYNITPKRNPLRPDDPRKYYASAKSDGEVTFKSLSREIAQGSTTVSDTDVLAVLNDLTKVLSRHLSEGKIVRFGDFGSFAISLSAEGKDAENEVNATSIKGAKIQFRPGSDLKDMLKAARFEKHGR